MAKQVSSSVAQVSWTLKQRDSGVSEEIVRCFRCFMFYFFCFHQEKYGSTKYCKSKVNVYIMHICTSLEVQGS